METVKLHSMIKKYFEPDVLLDIHKTAMHHDVDNNTKMMVINGILTDANIPFYPLGPGTNRYGIMIEDCAVKICLDEDGQTDNKREFIYSKAAQPHVIKTYECMANGLISTSEYFEVMSKEDFERPSTQKKMKEILAALGEKFLIGDIGLDQKNYKNWGYRLSDRSLGILDFAYIYNLSYKVFQCTCQDHGMLYNNETYTKLICPYCRREFTFADVRRRISRKQEEEEIGDIRTKGYVVRDEYTTLPLDPRFSPVKKKKEKKKKDIIIKEEKQKWNSNGYIDPNEFENSIMKGET